MESARQQDRVERLEGLRGEDGFALVSKDGLLGEEAELLLVWRVEAELLEGLLDVVNVFDELEGTSLCTVAALVVLVHDLVVALEQTEGLRRLVLRSEKATEQLDLPVLAGHHLYQPDGQHRDVEHAKVLLLALLEAQDGLSRLFVLHFVLVYSLFLLLLFIIEELVQLLDEANEVVADVSHVFAWLRRLDR